MTEQGANVLISTLLSEAACWSWKNIQDGQKSNRKVKQALLRAADTLQGFSRLQKDYSMEVDGLYDVIKTCHVPTELIVAASEIGKLANAGKWISVSDDMPKEGHRVIVYADKTGISRGCLSDDKKWYSSGDETGKRTEIRDVMYWMEDIKAPSADGSNIARKYWPPYNLGRWIILDEEREGIYKRMECSVCGHRENNVFLPFDKEPDFCPECGARLPDIVFDADVCDGYDAYDAMNVVKHPVRRKSSRKSRENNRAGG